MVVVQARGWLPGICGLIYLDLPGFTWTDLGWLEHGAVEPSSAKSYGGQGKWNEDEKEDGPGGGRGYVWGLGAVTSRCRREAEGHGRRRAAEWGAGEWGRPRTKSGGHRWKRLSIKSQVIHTSSRNRRHKEFGSFVFGLARSAAGGRQVARASSRPPATTCTSILRRTSFRLNQIAARLHPSTGI